MILLTETILLYWNLFDPQSASSANENCHRSTGSPLALSGILRGGMTVLEGAGILAKGTGFCT